MRKKIVTLTVLLLFLGSLCVEAFVHTSGYIDEGKTNDLRALIPYEKELESLNKEWGTSYKIQLEDKYTEQEMIEYFTSMSIEEFGEYMNDVHERDIEKIKVTIIYNKIEEDFLP